MLGQLVCFFSTLRVRDSKQDNHKDATEKQESKHGTSPASNTSNTEYFENTYSDFYKHPRTYEQFEEYKEIAAMSRQGRNATVLVGGTGGAFGEYAYDDDPDDIDDGLTNMTSLYFKPDVSTNGAYVNKLSFFHYIRASHWVDPSRIPTVCFIAIQRATVSLTMWLLQTLRRYYHTLQSSQRTTC